MMRRRKWVERVRGRWWRSRQMDEKGWPDMGHRLSSLSSQCAAQYPHQQSQQEINGSNKKVEGVFVNESIKVFQSRRFQFECFYLPRLHDGLLCGYGGCRWFGVPVSNDGLLLPFVFTEGGHFHRRFAGICPRHSPAIVPKIHLGKSFGVARRLCPFRPSIAVAVQRYAFDAKSSAALFELRGAVARTNGSKIRKQRAASRQVAQDFL